MKVKNISIARGISLSVVAMLGLSGCVAVQEPPHHAARQAPAMAQMPVRAMPEVIIEERGQAPAPGWHWINGYWRWSGNRWDWEKGHWAANAVPPMPRAIIEEMGVAPSPRHYWVPGHWVWRRDANNWTWINGRWYM